MDMAAALHLINQARELPRVLEATEKTLRMISEAQRGIQEAAVIRAETIQEIAELERQKAGLLEEIEQLEERARTLRERLHGVVADLARV